MPELPEVETTKRKLLILKGKVVESFFTDWEKGLRGPLSLDALKKDIQGKKVEDIQRKGKAVVFVLSKNTILAFHQKMSGSLFLKPLNCQIEKHVHNVVRFQDVALQFRDPRKFGVVWYGNEKDVFNESYFKTLGLDALSISLNEFEQRLLKHKGALKPLLLRQDAFAGIGNIIADETLFLAGISPKRNARDISRGEIVALHKSLQSVLQESIKAQGTTLRDWGHPDGSRGRFQNLLKIYGKKECPKGHKIQRIVVGGRGTWMCEKCQH